MDNAWSIAQGCVSRAEILHLHILLPTGWRISPDGTNEATSPGKAAWQAAVSATHGPRGGFENSRRNPGTEFRIAPVIRKGTSTAQQIYSQTKTYSQRWMSKVLSNRERQTITKCHPVTSTSCHLPKPRVWTPNSQCNVKTKVTYVATMLLTWLTLAGGMPHLSNIELDFCANFYFYGKKVQGLTPHTSHSMELFHCACMCWAPQKLNLEQYQQ